MYICHVTTLFDFWVTVSWVKICVCLANPPPLPLILHRPSSYLYCVTITHQGAWESVGTWRFRNENGLTVCTVSEKFFCLYRIKLVKFWKRTSLEKLVFTLPPHMTICVSFTKPVLRWICEEDKLSFLHKCNITQDELSLHNQFVGWSIPLKAGLILDF